MTKCLRNQFKEGEDLFGLTVSEVPVYGQLAPLLLGMWQGRSVKMVRHGRGKLHDNLEAEREDGTGDKVYLSRACSQ